MGTGQSTNLKRTFASGWLSDKDPLLMALIWQLHPPADVDPPMFEAEVVHDLDVIEVLRAPSLDELKMMLARKYEAQDS